MSSKKPSNVSDYCIRALSEGLVGRQFVDSKGRPYEVIGATDFYIGSIMAQYQDGKRVAMSLSDIRHDEEFDPSLDAATRKHLATLNRFANMPCTSRIRRVRQSKASLSHRTQSDAVRDPGCGDGDR